MAITTEEYDSQQDELTGMIANFHKPRINNNGNCGSGKTQTTVFCIAMDLAINPDHSWIIAVPTHKLIEGEGNILDMCHQHGIDAVQIQGKGRREFNPFFDPIQCYFEGCSKCENRDECPYQEQRFRAPVIICPYEMLPTLQYKIGRPIRTGVWEVEGWYGLVIEEEPLRFWKQEMDVTNMLDLVTISSPKVIDYWGAKYTFYDAEIDLGEHFTPENMIEYQLMRMTGNCTNFKVHSFNGHFTLFGHQNFIKPRWVNKLIFNCATTPKSIRNSIFGNERWNEIGIKKVFSNPMISIGYKWGINNTKSRMKQLKKMVNFMTAQGKKILVITKQVIETSLSLKDVDVVHYGSARGFNNNSKNYDLVIVYGAWHLPPYERLKLIELGIMEGSIIELENAEIVQAVNRFRPILRPQIPIIMMTQSIAEYQEETWTTVPDKSLEYYSLYPVVCADDIVMRDTDFSVSCYVGYKSVVDWLQRWVFNILNRNQRIVQCRYEHKTIAQTASRCGCSTSTVKRVYKKVIELYGDKLHRYERKLFELDI